MRTKRSQELPSREDQRRLILNCAALAAGNEISCADAGRIIGIDAESARHILSTMVSDRQLVRRGGGRSPGSQEVRYSRPPSNVGRRAWRRHTDEQLGLVSRDGEPSYSPPSPFNAPRASTLNRRRSIGVEELVTGPIISEAEVVSICRAHFSTFPTLQAAADHYGLTDGRLSQIQNGICVSCPRILSALGIKRDRSGHYRRIAA